MDSDGFWILLALRSDPKPRLSEYQDPDPSFDTTPGFATLLDPDLGLLGLPRLLLRLCL